MCGLEKKGRYRFFPHEKCCRNIPFLSYRKRFWVMMLKIAVSCFIFLPQRKKLYHLKTLLVAEPKKPVGREGAKGGQFSISTQFLFLVTNRRSYKGPTETAVRRRVFDGLEPDSRESNVAGRNVTGRCVLTGIPGDIS